VTTYRRQAEKKEKRGGVQQSQKKALLFSLSPPERKKKGWTRGLPAAFHKILSGKKKGGGRQKFGSSSSEGREEKGKRGKLTHIPRRCQKRKREEEYPAYSGHKGVDYSLSIFFSWRGGGEKEGRKRPAGLQLIITTGKGREKATDSFKKEKSFVLP